MELMVGVLLILSVIPILASLGNALSTFKCEQVDNYALIQVLKKEKKK